MTRKLALLAAIPLVSCSESDSPLPAETPPQARGTTPQRSIAITLHESEALASEIDAILEDPLLAPKETGAILLTLAPRLRDPAARAEALENALLLLAPEDYGIALDLATTPGATPEIQSAILEDALLRESHLRLPALLRITSSPHTEPSIKATALATLTIEIGQDYGTNWASWSDAIESLFDSETRKP